MSSSSSEPPDPQGVLPLIRYETPEWTADLSFDALNETIWITQQQMADLFGVDRSVIGKHLKNIFESNELDMRGTCVIFAQVRPEGGRSVTRNIEHFNLDAVLSVGYRVNSKKATEYRQWANRTLKQYIVQGFALNETRLRSDSNALRDLAAKVRALRSDEITVYQSVRDVYAFGSIDYDKGAPESRIFYSMLTDKFLYAVTGMTAAEIKLNRADHRRPNMGVQTMKGDHLGRQDIDIGKNYLIDDELYSLHILCEQFLLFVESKALRGQMLTMSALSRKFDELLVLQGHTVFSEYKEYLAQKAKTHAHKEFDLWMERVKKVPRDQRRVT